MAESRPAVRHYLRLPWEGRNADKRSSVLNEQRSYDKASVSLLFDLREGPPAAGQVGHAGASRPRPRIQALDRRTPPNDDFVCARILRPLQLRRSFGLCSATSATVGGLVVLSVIGYAPLLLRSVLMLQDWGSGERRRRQRTRSHLTEPGHKARPRSCLSHPSSARRTTDRRTHRDFRWN